MIILRLVIATALMFLTSFCGTLLLFIPWFKAASQGQVIGQGNAGIALVCLVLILSFCCSVFVSLLGTWALVKFFDRGSFSELSLRPTRRGMLWCVAMIAVAFVVLAAVTGILQLFNVSGKPMGSGGDTWWAAVLISLGLAFLLQGFPEELIWRGWLMQSLRKHVSVRTALLLATGGFGILHLVSNGGQENTVQRFIYLLIPLGFGFTAGVVRLASGSIWAAVGVHTGFHLASLLSFVLPIENSPTQWVLLGVAWVFVGAVIAKCTGVLRSDFGYTQNVTN